ncbi:MAG: ATP-binding protein [Streptosporangiaceae bacterium]
MPPVPYVPRLVDEPLESLFSQLPALLLVGPRAAGKTTSARRLARTMVRLDVPAQSAAFHADADAALAAMPEPVLLDEWQEVPELMGAVRRAVDDDSRPGRFLLTGSARARRGARAWSGIGRVVNIRMYGLTVRESLGRTQGPAFLERLAAADLGAFPAAADPPDLRGYVEMALRGGYPEPVLRLAGAARLAWLDTYVDQLVTRDAESLEGARDPVLLRRYLDALCASTGGVVADKTLYDAAGISRVTAGAYERLLSDLFVFEALPAWSSNRLTRLVKGPKRYLTDSSLVAAALRLDQRSVLRDGDILGRLIDTFAVAQLRAEAELSPQRPRLYHVREKDGRHEIDVLAETTGGDVIALEIKATAAPVGSDARHLAWLRDHLGPRFLAGAVLHTGPRPFSLGERLLALPICSLWT